MSSHIHIQFFRQLNDFLASEKRHTQFDYEFKKSRSVKDLIESIGIPHTEIDIILVNQESVDFNHLITGGETIQVYPDDEGVAVAPLRHNRPQFPKVPCFVLDVHLGRLAAYMRMLGLDTLYRNDYDDSTLAEISQQQKRTLITCDRRLLMRKQVIFGYLMRSRKPHQQIRELLSRFELFNYQSDVMRCTACNGIIKAVRKQDIESRLLPLTKKHYQKFYQCDSCHKIFWKGSHYDKMQALIQRIKQHQIN